MPVIKRALIGVSVLFAALIAVPAKAIDGVVLIDQNKALMGNVAPGDAPGFPVTIAVPGSYRLSGNLSVGSPETTIVEITANNVTLDLNGFALMGPGTCSVDLQAVTCAPLRNPTAPVTVGSGVLGTGRNITVQNGTISGMGGFGVYLQPTDASGFNDGEAARDLVVSHSGSSGAWIAGNVTRVTAFLNRGAGIRGMFVTDSVAERNSTGLSTRDGGTITRSSARANTSYAVFCVNYGFFSNTTALGNSTEITVSAACANTGQNFCSPGACPP